MVEESEVSDSPLAIAEQAELLVPGFRGYKERDLIRQDDALVRRAVQTLLQRVEETVSTQEAEIAAVDAFDKRINNYEVFRSKLRTLISTLQASPAGALSYYVRFKFTNDDQQALVRCDLKLLGAAKDMSEDTDLGSLEKKIPKFWPLLTERENHFFPEKLRDKM